MNQCIDAVSPEHLKEGEGHRKRGGEGGGEGQWKTSQYKLMPKHINAPSP